jgi:hypothetical protein
VWAWTPLSLTVKPGDRNRQLGLMALGLLLVLGPWLARNAIVLGGPVLSTSIGRRLLDGNRPETEPERRSREGGLGDARREPRAAGRETEAARNRLEGVGHRHADSEAVRDRADAAAAWGFLRERTSDWPSMAIARAGRFWTTGALETPSVASGASAAGRGPMAIAITLWAWLASPLLVYGFARTLASPRRWFQSLPAWSIVYLLVAAVIFQVTPTLRLPAEPLILLFAAAGLEDVRRRARTRGRGLKVIQGHR